jgi:hypothetical protein
MSGFVIVVAVLGVWSVLASLGGIAWAVAGYRAKSRQGGIR